MAHKLSLASGVLPEFGALDVIEAGAQAGFDAVGLWIDPQVWTAQHTRDAAAALARTGMPVLDVEVVWLKPGSAMDDHRKVLDVGAQLGAANVLCVSSHPDRSATVDELGALCRHAEGSGMRVALEFGIFTEVKTLSDALAVLAAIDHPLGAVLIDPIHVDRSGTTVAQIAAIDPRLLPYAQFCDALAQRPDPTDFDAVIIDAIDLRQHVGEGALPLEDMLQALPAEITLSLEMRSAALRAGFPDPTARAQELFNRTKAWLQRQDT
ncbi:sugar phosphate isomerase/epimerase family protein [Novosphingobium sp. Leaf2]|uniref:sugar phosphate isomerase/epimerase family protein n=1 Tax=Novosphingobium sp. Leaf2 TaxID=1735670 RepID=UPI0006F23FE7|nr:TIM barrel protein [Novosphingobium sp. Leaf2]KQM17335.1 xylose isomerase [Novosphingobium sp. Leaf2]